MEARGRRPPRQYTERASRYARVTCFGHILPNACHGAVQTTRDVPRRDRVMQCNYESNLEPYHNLLAHTHFLGF